MTNRLELNWKLDGFVDEQRYYCSETPIDPENLPVPKTVFAGDVRACVDTDIEIGKTYYVRVGSVKNNIEKISDESVVLTELWNPSSIFETPKIYLDDKKMQDELWESNTNASFSFYQNAGVTKPILVANAINNLPALHFSGSHGLVANLETTKSFAKSKKSIYVFTVTKLIATNWQYRRLFSITGSQYYADWGRFGLLNGHAYFSAQYWTSATTSTNAVLEANHFTSNDYEMILTHLDFDAGLLKTYKNGDVINSVAVGLSETSPTVDQTYPMTIGCQLTTSFNQHTNAEIACLVVNDEAITAEEISKIFGWAAHKYGLTDKLDILHPYKISPP